VSCNGIFTPVVIKLNPALTEIASQAGDNSKLQLSHKGVNSTLQNTHTGRYKEKKPLKNNQILGEMDFQEPLKKNRDNNIQKAREWAENIIKTL